LYALLHPDMGKWGGDAVPQSTVIWVWYKRNSHKGKWGGESMRQSTIIWECYKKNREKNIYLFDK